jgi:hypothetical protein
MDLDDVASDLVSAQLDRTVRIAGQNTKEVESRTVGVRVVLTLRQVLAHDLRPARESAELLLDLFFQLPVPHEHDASVDKVFERGGVVRGAVSAAAEWLAQRPPPLAVTAENHELLERKSSALGSVRGGLDVRSV